MILRGTLTSSPSTNLPPMTPQSFYRPYIKLKLQISRIPNIMQISAHSLPNKNQTTVYQYDNVNIHPLNYFIWNFQDLFIYLFTYLFTYFIFHLFIYVFLFIYLFFFLVLLLYLSIYLVLTVEYVFYSLLRFWEKGW